MLTNREKIMDSLVWCWLFRFGVADGFVAGGDDKEIGIIDNWDLFSPCVGKK